MPTLVVMIGIPGSGKSTLIQRWSETQQCLVISTDQIRAQLFGDEAIQGDWLLIWREVQRQFRDAIAQIQTRTADFAIYDATNTRRRNRRAVIALARAVGFTEMIGVWLDPPLELCVQRNQARFRQVPDEVLQKMYRQLWSCPPRLHEGLDLLLHYGTTPDLEDLLKQFEQQALAK